MTTPDTTTPAARPLTPGLFTVTTYQADHAGMWTEKIHDQVQVTAGQVVGLELGFGTEGKLDTGELVFILADGTRVNWVDPAPGQFRTTVQDGAPYTGDPAY